MSAAINALHRAEFLHFAKYSSAMDKKDERELENERERFPKGSVPAESSIHNHHDWLMGAALIMAFLVILAINVRLFMVLKAHDVERAQIFEKLTTLEKSLQTASTRIDDASHDIQRFTTALDTTNRALETATAKIAELEKGNEEIRNAFNAEISKLKDSVKVIGDKVEKIGNASEHVTLTDNGRVPNQITGDVK